MAMVGEEAAVAMVAGLLEVGVEIAPPPPRKQPPSDKILVPGRQSQRNPKPMAVETTRPMVVVVVVAVAVVANPMAATAKMAAPMATTAKDVVEAVAGGEEASLLLLGPASY